MNLHSAADQLLEAVLLGELSEQDPEVVRLFEARPELRARLAKLRRLASRLEDAGRDGREVIDQAAELAEAPGTEHVARTVDAARKRKEAFPWRPFLAAAAAVLMLLSAFQAFAPTPQVERFLGASASDLVHPVGAVESYAPFNWTIQPPDQGTVQVLVYDDSHGLSFEPIAESPRLSTSTWASPSSDAWPDVIRWELVVRDAAGALHGEVCEARAQRSSR